MRRAFTLIELLVVITIIAVLAAILFPVFGNAKQAGLRAKCLSNMKQLTFASLLYQGDYDDCLLPLGTYVYLGGPHPKPFIEYNWWGSEKGTWGSNNYVYYVLSRKDGLIWPYVKDQSLIQDCPVAPSYGQWQYWFTSGDSVPLHYGINAQAPLGQPASTLQKPSETIYFAESAGLEVPMSGGSVILRQVFAVNNDPYVSGGFPPGSPMDLTGGPQARHLGRAAVAWCDGHASAMPVSYMFYDDYLAYQSDFGISAAGLKYLLSDQKLVESYSMGLIVPRWFQWVQKPLPPDADFPFAHYPQSYYDDEDYYWTNVASH